MAVQDEEEVVSAEDSVAVREAVSAVELRVVAEALSTPGMPMRSIESLIDTSLDSWDAR